MSDYREVHEQAREHGLKARHETRVERAIRRQVAEEIAAELERYEQDARRHEQEELRLGNVVTALAWRNVATGYKHSAELAREIGSKETS